MRRMWPLSVLMVSGVSHAFEPYFWGVGPTVGMNFSPSRGVEQLPTPEELAQDFSVGPWDLRLGGTGTLSFTERHRGVFSVGLDLGKSVQRFNLLWGYHYGLPVGPVTFQFGGRFGGAWSWMQGASDRSLRVSSFPIRLDVGIDYKDKERAYEVMFFGGYEVPLNPIYVDEQGDKTPGKGAQGWTFGVEFTVYFGDFLPPRPKPMGTTAAR